MLSNVTGLCPDQLTFEQNLIGQWDNASAALFEGNFNETSGRPGELRFSFARNFYWSDHFRGGIVNASVFGGMSSRVLAGKPSRQLTWTQWRELHGGSQDVGSVLGTSHPFRSDDWAATLNLTWALDTPAKNIGFETIDIANIGPRT